MVTKENSHHPDDKFYLRTKNEESGKIHLLIHSGDPLPLNLIPLSSCFVNTKPIVTSFGKKHIYKLKESKL